MEAFYSRQAFVKPTRIERVNAFLMTNMIDDIYDAILENISCQRSLLFFGGPRGRVVKVADFSALDHSIISPMWVRASHGARIHM